MLSRWSDTFKLRRQLIPGEALVTITCALDLAALLPPELAAELTVHEERPPGLEWMRETGWARSWSTEADLISGWNAETRRRNGKVIWNREFQERQAGLLSADGDMTLRLGRDGTMAGTFQIRLGGHRSAIELIDALRSWRATARERFHDAVVAHFPTTAALSAFLRGTEATSQPLEPRVVDAAVLDYALIAIRWFTWGRGRPAPLDVVLGSPELAGIFNEMRSYTTYGARHRELVSTRLLAYRDDELFLVGRQGTLIVCERIWAAENNLRGYYDDLTVIVRHYLSCRAHLRQLYTITRSQLDARNLRHGGADNIVHNVLVLRLNLMATQEALDHESLFDQRFTRTLVEQLRSELGIDKAIDLLDEWLSTSEAIGLRESIVAAQRASALATRNNILQTAAVTLAILALIASILIAVLG